MTAAHYAAKTKAAADAAKNDAKSILVAASEKQAQVQAQLDDLTARQKAADQARVAADALAQTLQGKIDRLHAGLEEISRP